MKRMNAIAVCVLMLAANPESEAAMADRARLPLDEQAHAVYLTTSSVLEADREKLTNVLWFIVPSLSSKTLLSDQLPKPVAGTNLLRLDLAGLGWETTYAPVVSKHYAQLYRPDLKGTGAFPIVVDGLWFAANMLDPITTQDAQYQLLYGGKPPKTADEFLKFWGIQNDPEYLFGMIEGGSGVAVQRVRLIENRPGAKRNYGWLTRDSAIVAGANDPLENLPNKAKFDAQELIVGVPKWYGGHSGVLQAYFLANGKGDRQEKAPADIVVDHTNLRGVEIRNSASCIACHVEGIRPPSSDEFRNYLDAGARVFADKKTQGDIDRYLGSDVAKEVARDQANYEDGVKLCNGLTAAENSKAFVEIVKTYDAPVGLEQAARELYTAPDEFRLALGDYSRRYGLSGRLALMAQGRTVSRDQWINSFALAQQVLAQWQRK